MSFVIDVTNLIVPLQRGTSGIGFFGSRFLEVRDSIVYAGSFEVGGLWKFDATNPDSLIGTYVPTQGNHFVSEMSDSLLFASTHVGLKIYDISIPESLVTVTVIPEFHNALAIQVHVDRAYLATEDTFASLDITNPVSPIILNQTLIPLPSGGNVLQISLNGTNTFLASLAGVLIGEASSDTLKTLSVFAAGGDLRGLSVQDSLAYVSAGLSGLWILDVHDRTSIERLANIFTGGWARDVLVDGTRAYIASEVSNAERGEISIIDVSQPASPVLLNRISLTRPYELALEDGRLFVSHYNLDPVLTIVEVANVDSITILGTLPNQSYFAGRLIVLDSIVYLATSVGLKVVDARVPSYPLEIGLIPGQVLGIARADSLAYLDCPDSLVVARLNGVGMPTIVGGASRVSPGSLSQLVTSDDHLLSASGRLTYFGISEPTHPLWLSSVSQASIYGADNLNSSFILSRSWDGLLAIEYIETSVITDPKRKENSPVGILGNFPNPFNNGTTIVFETVREGEVNVEVFDLLGRKVATVLDQSLESGLHRIHFSPENLASGIYFCWLRFGDYRQSRKLLLMR